MREFVIVAVVAAGGAAGSIARHVVNGVFSRGFERAAPYATASVNLIGSFTIGLLAGLIAVGRLHMSAELRAFVFVGILGGFTTFSSFMLDTLMLAQCGDHALAFWNIAAQTAVGLLLVWGGYQLGTVV